MFLSLHELLDKTYDFLVLYVSFRSKAQCDALALWVAHTYVFETFPQSPLIFIKSPEKRCGKTRLLEVLSLLVANPWPVVNPSEAVIFRKIEKHKPTVLLDEIDTIFKDKHRSYEALRALLNAGNRKGVRVPRCQSEGKNIKLVEFSIFCPKALAGIGDPPGAASTIVDRSITIELSRKKANDRVEKFRQKKAEKEAKPLQEGFEKWAKVSNLNSLNPEMPDGLDDRAEDNWEPLLVIADTAGGDWPERARSAAVELSANRKVDDTTLGVHLLKDMKEIFEEQEGRLKTEEIIEKLKIIEESPWGDLNKGKPVSAHRLAKLLKPYGIYPRMIRFSEGVSRGYLKADFEDAWERYVPETDPKCNTATIAGQTANSKCNINDFQNSKNDTLNSDVTLLRFQNVTGEEKIEKEGGEIASNKDIEATIQGLIKSLEGGASYACAYCHEIGRTIRVAKDNHPQKSSLKHPFFTFSELKKLKNMDGETLKATLLSSGDQPNSRRRLSDM